MLSVPDIWDFSLGGLATLANDGIDGVRSGIRELEKHGYLTRRRIRDAGGRLGDIEYTIHEIPQPPNNGDPTRPPREPPPNSDSPILANPTSDSPTLEKPIQVLPTQENPTELNNNKALWSTNELNNKKHKPPCVPVEYPGQLTLDDTADASQQTECLTVQMAQGTGKPVTHTMTFVEQSFEQFWHLYPRKAGKKTAKKAWMSIKPDESLLATIMGALNTAVRYWNHHGVSLKHIPHPATWLNEERWEDELPVEKIAGNMGVAHAEKIGGEQTASIGANYTIGGEDDPYRTLMQG
ncbi:MAG: hypothetical protein FWC16_04320 [Defluviitaleaceae bacterium]|nr:hypothetical protein [Defluviitaleaceae bacterium]MCL2274132.1 hypothetical protein [Defluviitaleaceae bacterium]